MLKEPSNKNNNLRQNLLENEERDSINELRRDQVYQFKYIIIILTMFIDFLSSLKITTTT